MYGCRWGKQQDSKKTAAGMLPCCVWYAPDAEHISTQTTCAVARSSTWAVVARLWASWPRSPGQTRRARGPAGSPWPWTPQNAVCSFPVTEGEQRAASPPLDHSQTWAPGAGWRHLGWPAEHLVGALCQSLLLYLHYLFYLNKYSDGVHILCRMVIRDNKYLSFFQSKCAEIFCLIHFYTCVTVKIVMNAEHWRGMLRRCSLKVFAGTSLGGQNLWHQWEAANCTFQTLLFVPLAFLCMLWLAMPHNLYWSCISVVYAIYDCIRRIGRGKSFGS